MPVYLQCPHCDHPQVVPARRRGKAVFCRQCGQAYQTSESSGEARPLPVSSLGELHERVKGRRPVVLLDS